MVLCQHICPDGKEPFMASTQGQPLREEELGRVQRGGRGCLFVCSQSATIKKNKIKKKTRRKTNKKKRYEVVWSERLFSPNSYHFSVFILICSSNPASGCTHFFFSHPTSPTPLYSVPLILLPDYFGSDTQNGGGELRGWKAESGSHFLTDPGPSTERVKTFCAWWTIRITP